ncbi:hypothetical protein ACIHEI_09095 [Kitasatospora sp. NPDC051984]|uniref:hypothetical protein n=1 Tax=Kitasatospora sp. NPDC051984 TaxID=3364059 RepID=UPI0037C892F2
MKKLTALAALSLSGLALGTAPAHATTPTPLIQTGSLSQAHGVDTGYHGEMPSSTELCHRDLANYPLVGEVVERATGVCEAVGTTLDGTK